MVSPLFCFKKQGGIDMTDIISRSMSKKTKKIYNLLLHNRRQLRNKNYTKKDDEIFHSSSFFNP